LAAWLRAIIKLIAGDAGRPIRLRQAVYLASQAKSCKELVVKSRGRQEHIGLFPA
jgi:hypothetical protein